jgi:hypothetical protein
MRGSCSSYVIQRTVQELNGEPWLELDGTLPVAKQVMSSGSFGERVGTANKAEGSDQLPCRECRPAAVKAGIARQCGAVAVEEDVPAGGLLPESRRNAL